MSSPGRQRATEFAVDCKFSAPAHARGFRGAENLAERAVYREFFSAGEMVNLALEKVDVPVIPVTDVVGNLAERAVYRAWAGWAGSIRGHVMGPSTGLNIDAIQATIDGKSLPIQHYDDFSLVF